MRFLFLTGDGTFSFEEFVQVMANMGGLSENTEEDEEEELRQAFRVFDKSGCGYITPSDLRAVLQNIGENLTEEESKFSYDAYCRSETRIWLTNAI